MSTKTTPTLIRDLKIGMRYIVHVRSFGEMVSVVFTGTLIGVDEGGETARFENGVVVTTDGGKWVEVAERKASYGYRCDTEAGCCP